MTIPTRGPKSPYSTGVRTLLARTCLKCGKLADGDSFPLIASKYRRSECHLCFRKRKKRDREERGIGLPPSYRPPEVMQTNKYELWTQEENDYLREHLATDDVEDIAVHLGRSVKAIYVHRSVLGLASLRIRHRVEQPWTISHPTQGS